MYTWDPREYERSSSEQLKWARELIAKLRLRGDERVLDIGSGDGKVTAEIARQLPRGSVLGIDSSPEMVRHALDKHGSPLPNLTFRECDARSLPFEDEFDVVFSNATLHWIMDHGPVLDGIRKSLKVAGKILLQMGGKGNAADVVEVLGRMIESDRWSAYFGDFPFPYGFHGSEEYRVWLQDAGLRPVRVELIAKDMAHEGAEGFAGWARSTWLPYTQRIPESDREDFVQEIVTTYVHRFPADADGLVHVRMVRLEVEAVRP